MFAFGGHDVFNGRFDFFEWSAPYYENPKEVFKALNGMDLRGKKLVAINVIGSCRDIGRTNGTALYQTIRNAGIDPGNNWMETYPHMDDVLIPWNIILCEPIQFVFDDGSTLEILPFEGGGARIATNSIPVGMTDGLNDGGLNTSKFFQEFIGRKLSWIELKIRKKEEQHINEFSVDREKTYTEFRTDYVIQLKFESPYKLEIIQSWESWYEVCAKGSWDQERVPYKRKKEVGKKRSGPWIVNGRDGGGTFWIIGISSKEERESEIPNLDCFGMSIDDTVVGEYLTEFLYKYFDPSVQKRDEYEERGFDWYGGNLYTFETMRKMLDDIYQVMRMIREDYDNPELSKIKDHWPLYPYTRKRRDELSDVEINEVRKKAVPDALIFYERFCARMEHMLKVPGNDIMSFAGP